jgi:GNAT superfamily N-acetyltransferase
VLESDGTAIGFTHIGPVEDPPSGPQNGIGEVYTLYLDPDHLGRGAGRFLLGAAEARLAADGFDQACLWVLDTNHRARRFYERQGWALSDGIRTQKYGDSQGSDLRYVRTLTRPPTG